MKKRVLRDGREIIIRRAVRSDACKMVEYVSTIGGESDNLTFGLNEFDITADKEELIIESMNSKENSLMIVAEVKGEIVSMLSFGGGIRQRTRHVGEFGISVKKAFWSLGIGSAMIDYMLEWAKDTHIIRKINLKARIDNKNAIALYRKYGFREEGVSTRDLYIHEQFYDSLLMGLEID